jgi:hypothetical protein
VYFIGLWTAALTANGIVSLASSDGDGGAGAPKASSWALTPNFGESEGHEFGGIAAVVLIPFQ